MKRLHFSSFRQRLNAAFLAVSLVPMLLCSGLLLQIFRLRMTSNAQQTAQQQLSASCEALDTLHSGFLQTAASLQHNPLVAQVLERHIILRLWKIFSDRQNNCWE